MSRRRHGKAREGPACIVARFPVRLLRLKSRLCILALIPARTAQARRLLCLAFGLIAFLAGCATDPDSNLADHYQPPAAGKPVATLSGTNLSEGGMFGSDHRAFVNMVDLKVVRGAADLWNDPISLAPGLHDIGVEYHYSNLTARGYLPLDAKAGAAYQLRIKYNEDSAPGGMYVDFWIIDSTTGKTVSEALQQHVTGGKKGTIFYIPQ